MTHRELIQRTPEGLRLELPSPNDWQNLIAEIFMIILLVFTVTNIVSALVAGEPLGNDAEFSVIFLFIMVAIIPGSLWDLAGKELILFRRQGITIKRHLFGLGSTKEYPAGLISNLCTRQPSGRRQGHSALIFPEYYARLAFDYQVETICFGLNLTTEESENVLEQVSNEFPNFLTRRPSEELALTIDNSVDLATIRMSWNGSQLTLEHKKAPLNIRTILATLISFALLAWMIPFIISEAPQFGLVMIIMMVVTPFFSKYYQWVSINQQRIRIGTKIGIDFSTPFEVGKVSGFSLNLKQKPPVRLSPIQRRLSREFEPGERIRSEQIPPAFKFNYGAEEITFGRNLQEVEARIILATIEKYFPEYFRDS
ncbi:MAG: hypothetical protein EPO32_13170 [Anaerolineae bacterium]|nr:MAG: hypothetical protein EPO32_13170 [Anaerolineae bacterium]